MDDGGQTQPPRTADAVWVVESDREVARSLALLLSTLGVRAGLFHTAEDALRFLRHSTPAMLIVEMDLPAMTGLDLLETLQDRGLRIPTVGLTREATARDRQAAARFGVLDVLEKPLVSDAIMARVLEVLRPGTGEASKARQGAAP